MFTLTTTRTERVPGRAPRAYRAGATWRGIARWASGRGTSSSQPGSRSGNS
jgi:hypothetical protein